MDAQHSSLDTIEVHFVIDRTVPACVHVSPDVSLQAWLLNQQMQEVLLNGVSVEDASLDGLISKVLLQRLVDAANIALGRMSEGFSAATMLLKMGPENDASPGSPNELASMLDQAQTTHAEPAASEPLRKRPAQEKLEKEIAHYDIEIEKHSKLSGAEPLSREAELKKLRAASEYKLKRLRAVNKATKRWRESNASRHPPTRQEGRSSHGDRDTGQLKTPMRPGKHHRCGKCGKQFKIGLNLRMHQRRRHIGRWERSFSCDECNEIFKRHDHLTRHKLTHSGGKPFECESCHQRFTTTAHLKRHKLTHSGAKPFNCDICQKSFSRKDKLRIHQMVHSDERPFACTECGYRYTTLESREKHQKIHRTAQ